MTWGAAIVEPTERAMTTSPNFDKVPTWPPTNAAMHRGERGGVAMSRLNQPVAAFVCRCQLRARPIAQPVAPSAEAQCPRRRLDRIARIDPQLHSVIAVDPTRWTRRGRFDASRRSAWRGRRAAGADQGQYRDGGTAADHRRQPRARQQRHRPRCAAGGAAARGGRGVIGKTNLSEWANIRSNNSISGWSAVGGQTRNPVGARPQPVRIVERQRRSGRRRPGPPGDRHRDRRLDHLPGRDQRHRRA